MPLPTEAHTPTEVVEDLLQTLLPGVWLPRRVERASRHFLGASYIESPLIGGPDLPERFVDRLDGFDCVTYAETMIALARSATPQDFQRELRLIRYHHGRVAWLARNHYMSSWIERNAARQVVGVLDSETFVSEPEPRLLNVLEGYPPIQAHPRYLPKALVTHYPWKTGDILLFVSERQGLDFFHLGILVVGRRGIALRHASRGRGEVVEESLSDFLSRNSTPGVTGLRPLQNV